MLLSLMIVEENEFFRLGLKAALESADSMEVLRNYSCVRSLLDSPTVMQPDAVLVCVATTDSREFGAIKEIRERYPTAGILVMVDEEREEYVIEAMMHGASGVVLKSVGRDDLIRHLGIVASGGLCFNRELLNRLAEGFQVRWTDGSSGEELELTEREIEILRMLAKGRTNRQMAQTLHVSPWTVRNNITALRRRLGFETRVELAVYAVTQEASPRPVNRIDLCG